MSEFKCTPIEPITISIDKEYFRKKFQKVLHNNYAVMEYCDDEAILNKLMDCFDEKDEE